MESKQSKQDRLSVQKHPIFSPFCKPVSPVFCFCLFVVFLCMFGFLFFLRGRRGSTLIFFYCWYPDEDITPLATHTCSFLLTTVAQSHTVSLGDNRLIMYKRE